MTQEVPLSRKRQLYADFTQHLASRGTKRGIERWLRAFSVHARVYNAPQYWGEAVWGEASWSITDALGIVVQVDHLGEEVNFDIQAVGETVWGEGYSRETEETLTREEIENLIRFQWPSGQRLMVHYHSRRNLLNDEEAIFGTAGFNENSAPIAG